MYAVFGNPIEHSLSPYLINKLLNISCSKISLGKSFDKKALLDLLEKRKIHYGNVTYPYKKIFFDYSDSLKFPADKIFSINAFTYKDNKIISTNTDGEGFFLAIYFSNFKIYKKLINNKVILIAGTGSTAKSIAFSAKIRGITPIFISRKKNLNQNGIKFIIDYKRGLELIMKNHNHIIASTLPFSVLSIIFKNELEKEKIINSKENIFTEDGSDDEENSIDIFKFFNYAYEKRIIIFDSNYKNYLSIKKAGLNINLNDNLFDGLYQFIGQGLLSIHFFTGKNFMNKRIIDQMKDQLINESLR